ncbi:MAG: hypothetical protein GY950_28135, partial [bacterium]|nr:hypothetical protein [bacterium]
TSEEDLKKYKKVKFKPEGYHKKPFTGNALKVLLSRYLGETSAGGAKGKPDGDTAAEEDDIIFTEVLTETESEEEPSLQMDIDEIDDHPLTSLVEENTGEGKKPSEAVFTVSDGPSVDVMEETKQRERAARLVSLEKQNHFLRTENKRLTLELETLKGEIEKQGSDTKEVESRWAQKSSTVEKRAAALKKKAEEQDVELKAKGDRLKKVEAEYKKFRETAEKEKNKLLAGRADLEDRCSKLEEEKKKQVNRADDLNDRLTDTQRELVAKDYEFEKKLKKEADDLLRETEERLVSEFKETKERLRVDIGRLENDKMRTETVHREELNAREEKNGQLQQQIDDLKAVETSLNASISEIKEEKAGITGELRSAEEKITALEKEKESLNQRLICSEEDLTNLGKEKEKREKEFSASIDKLNDSIEKQEASIEELNRELQTAGEQLKDYGQRMEELSGLLGKAAFLTTATGE